mmetsp:Transcript_28097/g.54399  ORF Transcript_28097/g.54399 Transcript_28097/m.54399 type:complete len:113 (+) Transcript_28097:965-1303(+)
MPQQHARSLPLIPPPPATKLPSPRSPLLPLLLPPPLPHPLPPRLPHPLPSPLPTPLPTPLQPLRPPPFLRSKWLLKSSSASPPVDTVLARRQPFPAIACNPPSQTLARVDAS